MTNEKTNQQTNPKAPSHVAYAVNEREGSKGIWRQVGSAWPHAGGQGFNVQLVAMPLNGRITLRVVGEVTK